LRFWGALGDWMVWSGVAKGSGGIVESRRVEWTALANAVVVVFVFVLAARWALRPVDVGQLEDLKYRYKGA